MKRVLLLGVLGLWVSILPGCGGGGNDSPTSPPVVQPTPPPAVTTSLFSQGTAVPAAAPVASYSPPWT